MADDAPVVRRPAAAAAATSDGSSGGTDSRTGASAAGASVARRKVAMLRLASDLRRMADDAAPVSVCRGPSRMVRGCSGVPGNLSTMLKPHPGLFLACSRACRE